MTASKQLCTQGSNAKVAMQLNSIFFLMEETNCIDIETVQATKTKFFFAYTPCLVVFVEREMSKHRAISGLAPKLIS